MKHAARVICALAVMATAPQAAASQMADFLGPHVMETLPYEIPGTGRIGGVALDGWGYLYVANQGERVWKIHPDGRVEVFVEGLYGSAGGAMLPNADLLHAAWGGDEIVRVERDGTVHDFVTEGLDGPVGMVVVDDHVYTVNAKSNWVARITMDGRVREFVRDDRLSIPNGITADGEGNLYVVNLGNTLVLKITPDAEITEIVELPGSANAHVAYAQGALYVTQIWDNVVLRVEMDGSYRVVAGDGTLRARPGLPEESRTPFPNGIMASRRGDAVYFNTLEGNMINGDVGVIKVHKLHVPTPERAFMQAWAEGGMTGLRAKFEGAMKLQDVPREAIVEAVYGIGRSMLNRGEVEAGLMLIDWVAEVDEDEVQRNFHRGRAHLVFGEREVALQSLERASELAPDNEDVQRTLETARAYRRNSS